jgi:hypothetical protein
MIDVASQKHVSVSVRLRPLGDTATGQENGWVKNGNLVQEATQGKGVRFHNVFDIDSTNEEVFLAVGKNAVVSVFEGYNSTIFMYGQTGSGKTWTMTGSKEEPGLIPRSTKFLFQRMSEAEGRDFLVRASYLEIYNENIYDLCNGKKVLKPRMGKDKHGNDEFALPGIKEVAVKNSKELAEVQQMGESAKSMGVSNLNEHSSRSHCIFSITVESSPTEAAAATAAADGEGGGEEGVEAKDTKEAYQSLAANVAAKVGKGKGNADKGGSNSSGSNSSSMMVSGSGGGGGSSSSSSSSSSGSGSGKSSSGGGKSSSAPNNIIRVGTLHLVDLAGSESFKGSGGKQQQNETKAINKSLSALKDVITALAKKQKFVPFRNSALTKMLRSALGGNSLTHMLCTLHCSGAQAKESRFTVNFGNIAQQVENVPTQNETSDDSGLLLTKYRKEISHLNSKLARLAAIDREKAELEAEVDRLREMSGCLLDSSQVAESEARVAELERLLRVSEKSRLSIARELDEEKEGRLQALAVASGRDASVAETMLRHQEEMAGLEMALKAEHKRELEEMQQQVEHSKQLLEMQQAEMAQRMSMTMSNGNLHGNGGGSSSSSSNGGGGSGFGSGGGGGGYGGGGEYGADNILQDLLPRLEAAEQRAATAEQRALAAEYEAQESQSLVMALTMQMSEMEDRSAGNSIPHSRLHAALSANRV